LEFYPGLIEGANLQIISPGIPKHIRQEKGWIFTAFQYFHHAPVWSERRIPYWI